MGCYGPSSTANFSSLFNVILPSNDSGESLLLDPQLQRLCPSFPQGGGPGTKAAAGKESI